MEGAQSLVGSITSRKDVTAALHDAKPNVIFHTVFPQALGSPKVFHSVNVEGTRILLGCLRGCDFVKALVYTPSSSFMQDNRTDIANATEADWPVLFFPQQPEIYPHTKAVAETMILKANNTNNLCTCAIRPTGMFGEHDRTIAGNITGSAKKGNHKIQISNDTKLFDWTYVGNNADVQLLAARALLRSHSNPHPPTSKLPAKPSSSQATTPGPSGTFCAQRAQQPGIPPRKRRSGSCWCG